MSVVWRTFASPGFGCTESRGCFTLGRFRVSVGLALHFAKTHLSATARAKARLHRPVPTPSSPLLPLTPPLPPPRFFFFFFFFFSFFFFFPFFYRRWAGAFWARLGCSWLGLRSLLLPLCSPPLLLFAPCLAFGSLAQFWLRGPMAGSGRLASRAAVV